MTQSDDPRPRAVQLNSRSLRRPPVVEPMTPPPCRARPRSYVEPRCRRRPRRRRPAWTPYRHPLSAALATRLPLALPSTPHLCVASERACVRNGGRGVWRAPQKRPRPLLPPPRQLPLLPGPKSIDVLLSGPKRQKSSEKGRARSTRGAGGHQTLPTPWPIGTALAQAPDRSRRRPGSVLHCCTVDFLKKARR